MLAGVTGLATAHTGTPGAKRPTHTAKSAPKATAKTPTTTGTAPAVTGTTPATTTAPATATTPTSTSTSTTSTTTTTPSGATTTGGKAHGSTPAGRRRLHERKKAGGIVALSVTHDGKFVGGLAHAALARAAADVGGSIVDFSFSPSTITVHVGDTVTWTNTGQAPHTATATNGSFNTGLLHHGQSGSHTFNTAGTFSYYCAVHPYMKGTVVVLAATTTTTPSTPTTPSNTSNATTGTTPTTTTPSGPSLPYTGLDIGGLLLGGALMTGAGLVLRRRSHS